MSSSNQDWYVVMHIIRRSYNSKETTLACVKISKLVHDDNDNNSSPPRLERYPLPLPPKPDRAFPDNKGDLFFKNSATNKIQRLMQRLKYINNRYQTLTTIHANYKVYVMLNTTTFQVYDPLHDSWRTLPPPPIPASNCRNFEVFPMGHYSCGRMICILGRMYGSSSYVFDTNEEKWFVPEEEAAIPKLHCAVEFSGFLIGVSEDKIHGGEISIVAYKIDEESGLPDDNSKHSLDDELWELFYPPLTPRPGDSSLHRFGDDKIVLVSAVGIKTVVVAVFRVSVSTILGGIPVINAAFEHKQVYLLVDGEQLFMQSTFLMRDASSCCTNVSIMSLECDQHSNQNSSEEEEEEEEEKELDEDDIEAPLDQIHLKLEVLNKKDATEWDERLKNKSLYMCFVENRTDSSVSYVIKAIKFSDLVSTPSPKLRETASTSGSHLPCLPSCGLLGDLILFAGGGSQNHLRELEPAHDEPHTDFDDRVTEVSEQAPINKNMYCYDLTVGDHIIECFAGCCYKGMKPRPILVEAKGKLYALADSPTPMHMNPGPRFEVFNPVEKQWSPLPDPPSYNKFRSFRNYNAVAGSNILSWGGHCRWPNMSTPPGAFRFDMAAANNDAEWRLVPNSGVLTNDEGDEGCNIAVDSGDDFVLFSYKARLLGASSEIRVHLISREFESVVRLANLQVPESVSSLLREQRFGLDGKFGKYCSFVHLGDRSVCLVVSSEFTGPYSRSVYQWGEANNMCVVVVVFEFQVSEKRDHVDAEFVFQHAFEYFDDTNIDARRSSKTSDAHMVGAFFV